MNANAGLDANLSTINPQALTSLPVPALEALPDGIADAVFSSRTARGGMSA